MQYFVSIPFCILCVWSLMALCAPVLPLNPNQIHLEKILLTPEWNAWLGYDDLGRGLLDRLVMGARTSFFVAFTVVSISLLLGTLIGMFSAWYGGRIDKFMVVIMDIFMAFPGILLAIALSGLLGPGLMNAVIALSIVSWVGFARLARAQTLSIKHREHILSAISQGSGVWRIVCLHILPLILAPLIIEATFAIAAVVIAEASLSFLGLGVQPPVASWGSMIKDGTRYMLVAPHMVLVPGIAIFLVVLSVNLLGDRLRDYLDKGAK